MKNTKEIQPILAAIYCINRTNGNEDKDIRQLIDYAFYRILGSSTNALLLACIGSTKETAMPEILEVLQTKTQYLQYLKEKNNETI